MKKKKCNTKVKKLGWGGAAKGAVSGAAAGSIVPGWGTAIGGVVGGIAGYFTEEAELKSQREDEIAGNISNRAQSFTNDLNARGINTGNEMLQMELGGMLGTYSGQSHQGPNQGIPVDANGTPTSMSNQDPTALVEEGEFVWNGKVFSKKLGYADRAQKIRGKYKTRIKDDKHNNDKLAVTSLNRELDRLYQEQETMKQEASMEPTGGKMELGGYLQSHDYKLNSRLNNPNQISDDFFNNSAVVPSQLEQRNNWNDISRKVRLGDSTTPFSKFGDFNINSQNNRVYNKGTDVGSSVQSTFDRLWEEPTKEEVIPTTDVISNASEEYQKSMETPTTTTTTREKMPITEKMNSLPPTSYIDPGLKRPELKTNLDVNPTNVPQETFMQRNSDKFGNAAQLAGSLYNIGSGLFDKQQKMPYRAAAPVRARQYTAEERLRGIDGTEAAMSRGTENSMLSRITAGIASDKMRAQAIEDTRNRNQQERARVESLNSGINRFNVNQASEVDRFNAMNSDANRQMIGQGLADIGTFAGMQQRAAQDRDMADQYATALANKSQKDYDIQEMYINAAFKDKGVETGLPNSTESVVPQVEKTTTKTPKSKKGYEITKDGKVKLNGSEIFADPSKPKGVQRGVFNNNPGNLTHTVNGRLEYKKFNSPREGFSAMLKDVSAKINGKSAHIKPTESLSKMISVYSGEPIGSPKHNGYIIFINQESNGKITGDQKIGTIKSVKELAKIMAGFETPDLYEEIRKY